MRRRVEGREGMDSRFSGSICLVEWKVCWGGRAEVREAMSRRRVIWIMLWLEEE